MPRTRNTCTAGISKPEAECYPRTAFDEVLKFSQWILESDTDPAGTQVLELFQWRKKAPNAVALVYAATAGARWGGRRPLSLRVIEPGSR